MTFEVDPNPQSTMYHCEGCDKPLTVGEFSHGSFCTKCLVAKKIEEVATRPPKKKELVIDLEFESVTDVPTISQETLSDRLRTNPMEQDKTRREEYEYEYIGAVYRVVLTYTVLRSGNEMPPSIEVYLGTELIGWGSYLAGLQKGENIKEARNIVHEMKKKNILPVLKLNQDADSR